MNSEVLKITQIFVTLPVTTASNEILFSTLSQTKAYLRSIKDDKRFRELKLIFNEKTPMKLLDLML